MRYLIDTNIFLYLASDRSMLSRDVTALMTEPDALLYISVESVKELIMLFRKKKIATKRWKNVFEMVSSIEDEYHIAISPIKKEHILTYAALDLNVAQEHNDPSDHIIIAQAITEHMPLISSDRKFNFYVDQGLDLVYNQR